jgi:integrase
MKAKIANLPSGVSVGKITLRGEELWRVRLGKKFTGGKSQAKHFRELAQAREWIFGDALKSKTSIPVVELKREAGESAFQLTSRQIQEAVAAFKNLQVAKLGMTEAVSYAIAHLRPAGGNLTLSDAVKKVLLFKADAGLSPKHLKGMRSIFTRIGNDLGEEPLTSFTREGLEDWIADQDDVSISTKASYARHIHILFAEGMERGWCASNPASKLNRSSTHEGDIAVWTAKQLETFLDAVQQHEPQLLFGLALKAFAGLRTSELLRLEWPQIGDNKIQVLGKNAKTRRSRGIEIQPILEQFIPAKHPEQGLVVGLSENGWHDAVQRVCAAAKINMPQNVLRHSFGTYRYYQTKSEAETAYEMGNSPGVVLKHYRAVAVKDADVVGWWMIQKPKTAKGIRLS